MFQNSLTRELRRKEGNLIVKDKFKIAKNIIIFEYKLTLTGYQSFYKKNWWMNRYKSIKFNSKKKNEPDSIYEKKQIPVSWDLSSNYHTPLTVLKKVRSIKEPLTVVDVFFGKVVSRLSKIFTSFAHCHCCQHSLATLFWKHGCEKRRDFLKQSLNLIGCK